MAGQIPSFISGSKIALKIGDKVIAYTQSIRLSDDMQVQPVGGIGMMGFQSLEPTGYVARGDLVITHYSDIVLNELNIAAGGASTIPPLTTASPDSQASDGNSLLMKEFFSPANLLISRSFDIDIWERKAESIDDNGDLTILDHGTLRWRLENCRLTNYSMGFSPGSLVNESIAFMSTGLLDVRAGEIIKTGA